MHTFLDKYSVFMTSLLIKDKWFEQSTQSQSLIELCHQIDVSKIYSLEENTVELDVIFENTLLDPAFQVVQWLGYEYPTIIYHHGNNERPFDYRLSSKNTFRSILYTVRQEVKANLITIRAPFHTGTLKQFTSKMKDLHHFTQMIATSTNVIQSLVQHLKEQNCPKVVIVGLSLGGWVSNLHRSVYNSADVYIPIFARAALDSLFTKSYYAKLVSETAIVKPQVLKEVLNFEQQFSLISTKNIYPLLAKYDQFIEYSVQKSIYDDYDISTIEKGHITGALAATDIRQHILSAIG